MRSHFLKRSRAVLKMQQPAWQLTVSAPAFCPQLPQTLRPGAVQQLVAGKQARRCLHCAVSQDNAGQRTSRQVHVFEVLHEPRRQLANQDSLVYISLYSQGSSRLGSWAAQEAATARTLTRSAGSSLSHSLQAPAESSLLPDRDTELASSHLIRTSLPLGPAALWLAPSRRAPGSQPGCSSCCWARRPARASHLPAGIRASCCSRSSFNAAWRAALFRKSRILFCGPALHAGPGLSAPGAREGLWQSCRAPVRQERAQAGAPKPWQGGTSALLGPGD